MAESGEGEREVDETATLSAAELANLRERKEVYAFLLQRIYFKFQEASKNPLIPSGWRKEQEELSGMIVTVLATDEQRTPRGKQLYERILAMANELKSRDEDSTDLSGE